MKIAYNPKTEAPLVTPPQNDDITFDLSGLNIFAKGVKFIGTDTTYLIFKKHTSNGSGGNNGLVPVPSYTTTNNRYLREDGTWKVPVDSNVLQSATTTSNFRPIILGYQNSTSVASLDDTTTLLVYTTTKIYALPSTGTLYATKFQGAIDWSNINSKPTIFPTNWDNVDNKPNLLIGKSISSLPNKDLNLAKYNFGSTNKGDDSTLLNVPTMYGVYLSLAYSDKNQAGLLYFDTTPGTTGTLYFRTRNAGDGNTVNTWKSWKTLACIGDKVDWSNIINKPSSFTPSSHTHPSNQITALTGYTKGTSNSALTTSDSLNTALGKLEYKGDLGVSAYNIVSAATDGDGTIENLNEILEVLQGISDTDTIKNLLGKYLPLAGGIMSGLIMRPGVSTSWIKGRDGALIRNTTYTGYNPMLSMKTTDGSWELGVYLNNGLHLTYITDSDYNSNNNVRTWGIDFPKKSGLVALTSDIPTTANLDGRYIKIDGTNGTAVGVSTLINKLTTGSSAPTDNDYFISQYAGGGSTNITYHRRPISALWNYIAAKADTRYINTTGDTISGYLGYKSNYLIKPVADYRTTSSLVTGALTITLPTNIGNTMISMWVDVYNYATNTSFSVHVGGYTYDNSEWYNCFAMVYGAVCNVRFGLNGTNFIIYIGETGSIWAYPLISVRDVLLGYDLSYSNWIKNWTVSFSTTFSTILQTISHNAITTKNYTSVLSSTYYNKTESDGRYVNISGDTMNGKLIINTSGGGNQFLINNTAGGETYFYLASAGTNKGALTVAQPSYGTAIYNAVQSKYLGITDSGVPHFQGNELLHKGNYTSILDSRYYTESESDNRFVNVSGDTMTGLLYFSPYDGAVIGANANDGIFIQSKTTWLNIRNNIIQRNNTYTVWDSGNDGSGSGLDADLLDGLHESNFMNINVSAPSNLNMATRSGVYRLNGGSDHTNIPNTLYGQLLVIHGAYDTIAQMAFAYNDSGLTYVRSGNPSEVSGSGSWGAWQQLARTIDNVASANKLQNYHTFWGQYFNGEQNVSGDMTGVAGGLAFHHTNEINSFSGHLYLNHRGVNAPDSLGTTGDIVMCNNGGNVIIGKVSASYKLNVAGDIYADGGWLRSSGNTGWYNGSYGGGWWMTDSTYIRNYNNKRLKIEGINDYYAVWLSSGGFCCQGYEGALWNYGYGALNIGIQDNSAQTPLMIAYRNGSGVKNDDPSRLFAMEFLNTGSILRYYFGGLHKYTMDYNGNFTAYGSVYASHFYENSDIRYKTIVNNLPIKANQIANLPLFNFKWKDNENLLHTGTSAQAVQEILPYIVSGEDKLTLDYGVLGTIAGVIACTELTEQELEIEKLKKRVKELENKINTF